MTTKCYVADYDNKIMRLKNMLQKFNGQSHSLEDNINHTDMVKQENLSLKYYLQNINDHLDDMLNQPGMSDEELQNLEKDHKEILSMMNGISRDVNVANKHLCSSHKPCNTPNNINIHINSREIEKSLLN